MTTLQPSTYRGVAWANAPLPMRSRLWRKQSYTLLEKMLPRYFALQASLHLSDILLDFLIITTSLFHSKMYILPLLFALVVSVSSQDVSSLVAQIPACEVRSTLQPNSFHCAQSHLTHSTGPLLAISHSEWMWQPYRLGLWLLVELDNRRIECG